MAGYPQTVELTERWAEADAEMTRHASVSSREDVRAILSRLKTGNKVTLLMAPPSTRVFHVREYDAKGSISREYRILDGEMLYDARKNAWMLITDPDLRSILDRLLVDAPLKKEKLASKLAQAVFGGSRG